MSREPPPPLSGIPQIAWPAMVNDRAAQLLALQYQFDTTQFQSPAELRLRQFEQLTSLLRHAAANVPFYAERLSAAGVDTNAPLTEKTWARIPILTRQDVQQAGEAMHATSLPPGHGRTTIAATSGSTGVPVRVRRSELDALMWHAALVREEIWHREDMLGTIARIRSLPPGLTQEQILQARSGNGLMMPNWGPPTSLLWMTGHTSLLSPETPIEDQVSYLCRLAPRYLQTVPSNLRLLLHHLRETGITLTSLRAVWTLSEVVDDALRALCRDVLGVRIVANYTATEVGYIALQCPDCTAFHVQSELLLVEVLDAAGQPCAPGQIGRVIATPLHSFAMPLLRYEIGDEAELGEACACGRGLPVLTRVVGRTLDYLSLPDGRRRRPDIPHLRLSRIVPIREFQLVQRNIHEVELALVVSRTLSTDEETAVSDLLREAFPEFRCVLAYRDAIPRTAAGKLRPFLSDLAA